MMLEYGLAANGTSYQRIGLKTISLFESVTKRKYSKDRLQRILTPVVELNIVLPKPGVLLHEIKYEPETNYGVELCESTIFQFLYVVFLIRR